MYSDIYWGTAGWSTGRDGDQCRVASSYSAFGGKDCKTATAKCNLNYDNQGGSPNTLDMIGKDADGNSWAYKSYGVTTFNVCQNLAGMRMVPNINTTKNKKRTKYSWAMTSFGHWVMEGHPLRALPEGDARLQKQAACRQLPSQWMHAGFT